MRRAQRVIPRTTRVTRRRSRRRHASECALPRRREVTIARPRRRTMMVRSARPPSPPPFRDCEAAHTSAISHGLADPCRFASRSTVRQHQSPANLDGQVSPTQFRCSTSGSHPGTWTGRAAKQQELRRCLEEPGQAGGPGISGRGTPCQPEEQGATALGQGPVPC